MNIFLHNRNSLISDYKRRREKMEVDRIRRMALLTSVYTITCEVKENARKNYT